MKVLRHLKRFHPDVVFLQESHLVVEDFHRMAKLWVGLVFGSPAVGGRVDVLTLIIKHIPFAMVSQWSDMEAGGYELV